MFFSFQVAIHIHITNNLSVVRHSKNLALENGSWNIVDREKAL